MNKELEKEVEHYFSEVLKYDVSGVTVDSNKLTVVIDNTDVIITFPIALEHFMVLDKASRMLFILSGFIIATK